MSDGRHMRIDRIRDTEGNLTAANLQINIQEEPANSDPLITQYRYDNAGNPILINTQDQNQRTVFQRQLSYGARGELKQIKEGDQSSDYRYNYGMQRVSKTHNSHQQHYLWQQGLLDAKIDVQKDKVHLSRRYIYVGLRPIAVIVLPRSHQVSSKQMYRESKNRLNLGLAL
jgi:hypothetical protein